jgi:hypothetical protein
MIVSRTYSDTPDGTFGQYVPAVPVLPTDEDQIFLTGLVHNLYYRTNIGLANFTPDDVGGIVITILDESGTPLGAPINTGVPGYSTTQIVEVAEAAGILTDVNIFSVLIDTGGADLTMYASVVDNFTGDPVLFAPIKGGEQKVWIPGVAHLMGENDSEWRTDITFLNDTDDVISAHVEYVPDEDLGFTPFMTMTMEPGRANYYVDVLGVTMLPPDTESKGYFIVEGIGGTPVPYIAARTYNIDLDGGTFGQNIKVYGAADLVYEGERSFIPGLSNSSVSTEGFRANLGVLNTDDQPEGTLISITMYDTSGTIVAELIDFWLAPGQFLQANLFDSLGLGDMDMVASVEVDVVFGGPIAVYGSEIDNRTQDPILVPAVPMMDLAR